MQDSDFLKQKARGALLGLAAGDALGMPTEGMTRQEIVRQFGVLDDFTDKHGGGTDDTEYMVLTALALLRGKGEPDSRHIEAVWRENLLGQDEFRRGGKSERDAIDNLKRGMRPPRTGLFGSMRLSDGAAMRIAPCGVYWYGDPQCAAASAQADASVSHAYDGIWAAQALAASVAEAVTMENPDPDAVVEAGLAQIPSDSWIHFRIREACDIARGASSLEEAYDDLIASCVCVRASIVAEAVAQAFAVFAKNGSDTRAAIIGGANLGRDADTVAAMAGALAGAMNGEQSIPQSWRDRVRIVRGTCIHSTRETDLADLANRLIDARANV